MGCSPVALNLLQYCVDLVGFWCEHPQLALLEVINGHGTLLSNVWKARFCVGLPDFPAQRGAEMCCGLCTAGFRAKIASSDVFTWVLLSSCSRKTLLKPAFDLALTFLLPSKNKKGKKERRRLHILKDREIKWMTETYHDVRSSKIKG